MKRFIAALILCGILLSSCSATYEVSIKNDLTKLFVGLKHHEIIKIMGAPTRETSDGLGGLILVYEDVEYESISSFLKNSSVTNTKPIIGYIHHYINKDGLCYNVETNYTKSKEDDSASIAMAIITSILGTAALVGSIIYVNSSR